MKAIVYSEFGPPEVLKIKEVKKPGPGPNEVLIKVHATTVTAGDWRARSMIVPKGFGIAARLIFGFNKPRLPVLGTELAGEIEAVGPSVTKFKAGDQIFASVGAGMGAYAEYKCLAEDVAMALKPADLTYGEAASLCFGGTTAIDFFRRGNLKSGDDVLIIGASGGVGTAAVQIAKYYGANVTGVCSTVNVELVQSLGADDVIDYTVKDFSQNGVLYDIIMDNTGTAPYARVKPSLKKNGRFLLVNGSLADMLRAPFVSMISNKSIVAGVAKERVEDLEFLARLTTTGDYKPVIDRRYRFDQIVEAHRYVDTGRKKGNVVITLDNVG